MIWLLFIIFIPGGLNQNISTDVPYRIIHPCDDTSISAVIQSPVQRHLDQYDLLIPIPIWGDDLILTFDSEMTLKLINPGRNIHITNDLHSTHDYHLKFINGTEKLLNCTILVPLNSSTIPYVQSIRLNQVHQLCNHPKTGYFYDVESPKRTVLRDIASSTMSNAANSGDTYKRFIRDTVFEHAFGNSASNGDTDDFYPPSRSFPRLSNSASFRNVDDFFTPSSQSFSTYSRRSSNGNTDGFFSSSHSYSSISSSSSNVHPDDFFSPSRLAPSPRFRNSGSNADPDDFVSRSRLAPPPRFRNSGSNAHPDDFFPPPRSVPPAGFRNIGPNVQPDDFIPPSRSVPRPGFRNIGQNVYPDDFYSPSRPAPPSRFKNSGPNGNTDDFFTRPLSTFMSESNGPTDDFFKPALPTFVNKASAEKDTTRTPPPPSPKNISHRISISPDESCGIQKVVHTSLIVNGRSSYSGQWPWHVALFRVDQRSLEYICGATLLSKTLVLTAAHCTSIRGSAVVPESLKVHLGRFDLFGGDSTKQEREVFRVIVHPKYDELTQDNDIALLQLKSEVDYTDYVRPACLWYERASTKLPMHLIFGTIAGWGLDEKDLTSQTLRHTTAPFIPELDCLKSNAVFFDKILNSNKFCGGYANGTAACNGDSGGGFMIFVPDAPGTASGAWFVRGIVSLSVRRKDKPICDPNEYTVFTDVEKYRDWLLEYMD